MSNKPVSLGDELHIGDKVFFIRDKKAYYAGGKEVEKDKAFVCQHCTASPPFVALNAKDFAEHIVDKHPDKAKAQVAEADKTEKKSKKRG